MIANTRRCLLVLLVYGCRFIASELTQLDEMDQKWTIGCNCEPETNNSLVKELCETRVEFAKLDERRSALQTQVDSHKGECNEKLAALKAYNEQLQFATTAFHEKEKHLLWVNCELRINLALRNETISSECWQKLDECQIKAGDVTRAMPGMATKDNLIKLATGYYHISAKSEKANWFIASKRCKLLGLELVSIETKEEDDALMKVLTDKGLYWTSGTDQGAEGNFYWASTGQQLGIHQNFDAGQPDNAFAAGEHCLEYWPEYSRKEDFKWNDRGCDHVSRYICEYRRL